MPDLDDLYRLLPAKFVPARDARAAELRKAGDKQGAAVVKALRRPSLSAWLANWLAHERAEDLGRLLDLGAALRQAQEHLEADDLRQLSRQRQQVVSALIGQAYAAGLEAGLHVTDQATRELQSTLAAALADEDAAEAVRAGQLTVALDSSGFGPGLTVPAPQKEPKRQEQDKAPDRKEEEEAEARQQAREAADAELEAASARREEREARVIELQATHDQVTFSLQELQHQLDALSTDLDHAREDEAQARHEEEAARSRRDGLS